MKQNQALICSVSSAQTVNVNAQFHVYTPGLSLCVCVCACMLRLTATKVIRCHPIPVAIVMAQQNGSGKVRLHLLLLVGGLWLLLRKLGKQNRSKLGLCFHHVLHRGDSVSPHAEKS